MKNVLVALAVVTAAGVVVVWWEATRLPREAGLRHWWIGS